MVANLRGKKMHTCQDHEVRYFLITNRRSTLKCKHKTLLKGNYNMMLTTRNITSRTPEGSCHMKYTILCNEEKINKPSTSRYLTARPNHK